MGMNLLNKNENAKGGHSTTPIAVQVARWIGIITHPILLAGPVAIVCGVHELGWPSLPLMVMGVTTFFASIGVPAAVIAILYRQGMIGSDLFLFRRKNRYIVYPFIIIGFIIDVLLFTLFLPLAVGRAMSWAGLLVAMTLFLTNFVTKISVHGASIGAIFMGALTVYGKESLVFLPLIPVIIWARVTAGNHSLKQAVAGLLVGGVAVWMTMFAGWPDLNKMTWNNVQGYKQNPPAYWLPFTGRPK